MDGFRGLCGVRHAVYRGVIRALVKLTRHKEWRRASARASDEEARGRDSA